MGYASWRVWLTGAPLPLTLYLTQLVLNFAWSPLFFVKHDLKAAAVDISGVCVCVWGGVFPGGQEGYCSPRGGLSWVQSMQTTCMYSDDKIADMTLT
jgi:hypothetical protein